MLGAFCIRAGYFSHCLVGYSDTPANRQHGFVYTNGTLTDLNSYNPDPNGSSQAVAVNDNGQILLRVTSVRGTTTHLILTPSGRKR